MITQVRIVVSGRVQGVMFRAHTERTARGLGLKGYVQNLDDGDVEIVAEGEHEAVQDLIRWAHAGSPHSRVDRVDVEYTDPTGGLWGFHTKE